MSRWRLSLRRTAALIVSATLTATTAAAWTNTHARLRGYYRDVLARADAAWGYPVIVTSNIYEVATTNRTWTYGTNTYTLTMPVYTNQVVTNGWNVGTNVFTASMLRALDATLLDASRRYVSLDRAVGGNFDAWFAKTNLVWGNYYLATNLNVRADMDAQWRQVYTGYTTNGYSGYIGFRELYSSNGLPAGNTTSPERCAIVTHPDDYPFLTPAEIALKTGCAQIWFPVTNEWGIVDAQDFSWAEYRTGTLGSGTNEDWTVWQAQSVPVQWRYNGADMKPANIDPHLAIRWTNYLEIVAYDLTLLDGARSTWQGQKSDETVIASAGWRRYDSEGGTNSYVTVIETEMNYYSNNLKGVTMLGVRSTTNVLSGEITLADVCKHYAPVNPATATGGVRQLSLSLTLGDPLPDVWTPWNDNSDDEERSIERTTNTYAWAHRAGTPVPTRFFAGSTNFPAWRTSGAVSNTFDLPAVSGVRVYRIDPNLGQVLIEATETAVTNGPSTEHWTRITNAVYASPPPAAGIILTLYYPALAIHSEPSRGWRGSVLSQELMDARNAFLACLVACPAPDGAWAWTNGVASTNVVQDDATAGGWHQAGTNDTDGLAARIEESDDLADRAADEIDAVAAAYVGAADALVGELELPEETWFAATNGAPARYTELDLIGMFGGGFRVGWIEESYYGSSTDDDLLDGYSQAVPIGIGYGGLGSAEEFDGAMTVGTNVGFMVTYTRHVLIDWTYSGNATGNVAAVVSAEATRAEQSVTNWPSMMFGNTSTNVAIYGATRYSGWASSTRTRYGAASNPVDATLPDWPTLTVPSPADATNAAPVFGEGVGFGETLIMVTNTVTGATNWLDEASIGGTWVVWRGPVTSEQSTVTPDQDGVTINAESSPLPADGTIEGIAAASYPRTWVASIYGTLDYEVVYLYSVTNTGPPTMFDFLDPMDYSNELWTATNVVWYAFTNSVTFTTNVLGTYPTGSVSVAGMSGAINWASNSWSGVLLGNAYYVGSTNHVHVEEIEGMVPVKHSILGSYTHSGPTNALPDVETIPVEWSYIGWEGDWIQWLDYGRARKESSRTIDKTVTAWQIFNQRMSAGAQWLPLPPLVFWDFED